MKVTVDLYEADYVADSSPCIVLKDAESGLPVAEISVRGAGYIVLTSEERTAISENIRWALDAHFAGNVQIPDREGGYHGEPPLWRTTASEMAAKREAQRGGGSGGSKKVATPKSENDILIPEGAVLDHEGLVSVPSRKGETPEGKKFRRACRRARRQQIAWRAAQSGEPVESDAEDDED